MAEDRSDLLDSNALTPTPGKVTSLPEDTRPSLGRALRDLRERILSDDGN